MITPVRFHLIFTVVCCLLDVFCGHDLDTSYYSESLNWQFNPVTRIACHSCTEFEATGHAIGSTEKFKLLILHHNLKYSMRSVPSPSRYLIVFNQVTAIVQANSQCQACEVRLRSCSPKPLARRSAILSKRSNFKLASRITIRREINVSPEPSSTFFEQYQNTGID